MDFNLRRAAYAQAQTTNTAFLGHYGDRITLAEGTASGTYQSPAYDPQALGGRPMRTVMPLGRWFTLSMLVLLPAGCSVEDRSGQDRAAAVAGSAAPAPIRTKSGVEMVPIPAGEFVMGDDRGEDDEKPAQRLGPLRHARKRGRVVQRFLRRGLPARRLGESPSRPPALHAASAGENGIRESGAPRDGRSAASQESLEMTEVLIMPTRNAVRVLAAMGTAVLLAARGAGLALPPAGATAAEPGVGFLVPKAAVERLDTECDMTRALAERLTGATAIVPDGKGRFVDRQGRDVSLGRLRAVWCHEGDTPRADAPAFDPQTVKALRQFVDNGGGLWLSGGAAALVDPLGVDKLRVQAVRTAQDTAAAGLVPAAPGHPALRGLDLDRGVLWLSNAAFPAFAEFRFLGRPAKGTILARSPGGPDCPLVEYQAGKGRVIALGWRLDPLYVHAPPAYRRNFERLAANVVRYLGDPPSWRPLAVHGGGRAPAAVAMPGVLPTQWRSLDQAIRDLRETFGPKLSAG